MRRADLVTGATRIRKALENLESVWDEASDQWDDTVSRRFYEQYLEPMRRVLHEHGISTDFDDI